MANPFASVVGQRRAQSLLSRGSKVAVPFGPWPKGMINSPNILSKSLDSLDDVPEGAASLIINMDVLESGALQARRGFQSFGFGSSVHNIFEDVIGSIYSAATSSQYILVSELDTTTNTLNLYWATFDFVTGSINTNFATTSTFVGAGFGFSGVHLYQNKLWLVSKIATLPGKQSGAGILPPTSVTWADVATMPTGDFSVIHKERLFIVNASTSRVYYSKATDLTTWSAPDGGFFDVSFNQGSITGIVVGQDNIYIFKDTGVWLFTFVTDPAIDGYLRKISDIPIWDALFYNGIIYCVGPTGFFALSGSAFRKLNTTIEPIPTRDFSFGTNKGFISSVFRVGTLVGYTYLVPGTNQSRWAVYNTESDAWVIYDFTHLAGLEPGRVPTSLNSLGRHGVEFYSGIYKATAFPYAPPAGTGLSSFWYITSSNDIFSGSSVVTTDTRSDALAASPKYVLQTRRYKPTDNKLYKFLYGAIDWRWEGNQNPPTVLLKFLRSTKRTEFAGLTKPNNPTGGQITKPEFLFESGLGPTYSALKLTNDDRITLQYNGGAFVFNDDPSITYPVPSGTNNSQRVRTRSTTVQLFIDSLANAINVNLTIFNIYAYVSYPKADVNDPISTG